MAGVFSFKFDGFKSINIRSRAHDVIVLTFTIFINDIERGRGGGVFSTSAGLDNPTSPHGYPDGTAANVRQGMNKDWSIGPFQLDNDDLVRVVYTGYNTSDDSLSDQDFERLQLDFWNFGVRQIVPLLEFVEDPIGSLIGWERQGPCNGLVFADDVPFTGRMLTELPFAESPHSSPKYEWSQITKGIYTDEASHNHDNCGDIAQTSVRFSVRHFIPPYSVRTYALGRNPSLNLRLGLVQLEPTPEQVSVKNLVIPAG